MNKLDLDYQNLLKDILENGTQKETRNGGTISVFGRQIRHKMSEGFPLLTTKKMAWKQIVTELLWFLRGDTNIKYLVDNDCHIWDGDCYKAYLKNVDLQDIESRKYEDGELTAYNQEEFINCIKTDDEFAKKWGELGPIYGKQWRSWKFIDKFTNGQQIAYVNGKVDQIANLIRDLKTNPDSRRLMVNAWNVGELDSMTLPPCHYGFQVYTRELSESERFNWYGNKIGSHMYHDHIIQEMNNNNVPKRAISLMWNQRSVDTFLGLPFNIASYGLLLEIIAKEVNMVPDELIGNLGDVHLYSNHIEQAKEQIGRDLTEEERYNIWFKNNYETGMERYFDPNNLPDFDDEYYEPTPKRTREPFPLPKLNFSWYIDAWTTEEAKKLREDSFDAYIRQMKPSDFVLENYQSHPTIKAPLSN
jgi:thymidylate synthase